MSGALLQAGRREQIRGVMRYAGPRMLLRHPILAFYHLAVDSRREKPERADWKTKWLERTI